MHGLHILHYNKEYGDIRPRYPLFYLCIILSTMKNATTIEEQISLLRERGMHIPDTDKAGEILLDIGYYRLGFYWFPYERNFPSKNNRDHMFREGTTFDKVIALYYFDHDLRSILSPYLYRIEVNLRTFLIYTASNLYRNNPTWFADNRVVSNRFIEYLPSCYATILKNEAIKHHHRKYRNDIYAPAWKTLEYMTFGDILYLISNLKSESLRKEMAGHYDIRNVKVFESYMNTIRLMRNLCAHGHNIYDLKLQKSIKAGPISDMEGARHHNLTGALMVISYVLENISKNRAEEMKERLGGLVSGSNADKIRDVIEDFGIEIL